MKYIKQLLALLTIVTFTNCSTDSEFANPVPDISIHPTAPTVVTNTVTAITMNTAASGGNITTDGGSPVTLRGVVWSKLPNPTTQLTTKTLDGSGAGAFSSAVLNLDSNTTYYIRAYAVNAYGTAYGNEISFKTLINPADLPVLTTTSVTDVTTNSAVSGGNVTSSGVSPVTSRGIVWGLNPDPTILINIGMSSNGIGLGAFTSNAVNLSPNTTYYVKAYATNSQGTAYGNEFSFTTSPLLYTVGNGVNDIDGNHYNSVILSGKEWTTSNLNVTQYTDGTPIPQVQNASDWANLTTGAWCYYAFQTSNGVVYAKLYNWYAVAGIWNTASKTDPAQRKKLAPTGWHVPTNSDWNSVTTYLGGAQTAGGLLKETGPLHWQSPNTGAVNSSGFTALPGGNVLPNGTFGNLGTIGYWWSSNEYNLSSSWCAGLYSDNTTISNAPINKNYGFSVRLVKD
ncbi:fibrobacter succinogenes major paralogous domain-containing protein [Flavobacterium silvisoli]|nr:fibrobacter succinogenes major paralogous domain-containing protein [Flavobacterium silvisoli]